MATGLKRWPSLNFSFMLYRAQLIIATLLICTFIVIVMLAIADIAFTPLWLLPIVGGLFFGIGIASLRRLPRRPTLSQFFGKDHLESSIQLGLGTAFMIVGFLLV